MALSINSFQLGIVAGAISLQGQGMVLTGRVSASQTPAIVAGQAVKLVTSSTTGGIPEVESLTSATDVPFGVAIYNIKDASYAARAKVELALRNTIIYMTAASAITQGSFVKFDYLTNKISLNTDSNIPSIGVALDRASADGDLIRVIIGAPQTDSASA